MASINLPKLPKMKVPLFREENDVKDKIVKKKRQRKGRDEKGKDKSKENNRVLVYQQPEKKHLCKYFVKNACIRGRNCTFSHDLSKFPCKLFHIKKNCRRKNCQFSHAPISKEEIKQLISEGWEMEEEEKEEEYVSPFL
ncbi:hypothetical protein NEFER03_0825 [Nematocida sp. LUAm3]|nr:hypothetical protein NEFER03_0825 [Nematocida sp. LUAm3]KAI5174843.1 hypothetical protein NEFER02_0943 [Nematocida sp. LUAm2]KAI5177559.1 hypothetical protein NEFER01_0809 [Nematocida sp. LUAm1]